MLAGLPSLCRGSRETDRAPKEPISKLAHITYDLHVFLFVLKRHTVRSPLYTKIQIARNSMLFL